MNRENVGTLVKALWSVGLAVALGACGPGSVGGVDGSAAGSGDIASSGDAVTSGKCPSGATTLGIDVSSYQGNVNWSAVKRSGVKFAIARVSDGFYIDSTFSQNWRGMKAAGLIRGAYQFFEPGENAVAQANEVISRVGKLGAGDLPVMLDVEVTGGQSASHINSQIHAWVNAITAGTGKRPFIYTGAYFWDGNIGSGDFSSYALDVAWYGTNCPGTPNAWSRWTFHQFTDRQSVSGVSGGVDADVFNGDLAALERFAGASAPPPPPPATLLENTSVKLSNDANGHIRIFGRGTNNEVYTNAESPGLPGGWTGWKALGGQVRSDITSIANKDGRLEIFAIGMNGEAYHKWETTPSGVFDPTWSSLGGHFSSEVIPARDADGRLEIFGIGTDHRLYHAWQETPGGRWSAWSSLGGTLTSAPAVTVNKDGRLEVLARGTDNALYGICQVRANGAWSNWYKLGGSLSSPPALVVNADGRLEVFVRGSDGKTPYHNWQNSPGGRWSGFHSLGGAISSQMSAILTKDGRVEVFGRGENHALYHAWQTSPGGAFHAWSDLGGVISSSPEAARNADGRLEVFATGAADAGHGPYHIWEQGNLAWTGWSYMGGAILGF